MVAMYKPIVYNTLITGDPGYYFMQKESLPNRYDRVLSVMRDPERKVLSPVTLACFSATSHKPKLPDRLSVSENPFIGNRMYLHEVAGDLLETAINSDPREQRRLLGTCISIFDLNNFRSFDKANPDEATRLKVKALDTISQSLQNPVFDYRITLVSGGDEFAVISNPRKQMDYSEIVKLNNEQLAKMAVELGQVTGKFDMGDGTIDKNKQVTCKGKSAFLSEALAKLTQNTCSTFEEIVSAFEYAVIDYKDPDSERTVNLEPGKIVNSFGLALEEIEEKTSRATEALQNASGLTRKSLQEDNTAELDIDPKYYPDWMQEMPILIGTDPSFSGLTVPYLKWLRSLSLTDSFSSKNLTVYNHDGLISHLRQDVDRINPNEKIVINAFDLALLKETNDRLGHGPADNSINQILGGIALLKEKYESSGITVSKENGVLFVEIKGDKNQIDQVNTDLVAEINGVINNVKLPDGILEQNPYLPQNPELKLFAGHAAVYIEKPEEGKVLDTIHRKIDEVRNLSGQDKTELYREELCQENYAMLPLLRYNGGRTSSRIERIEEKTGKIPSLESSLAILDPTYGLQD